ncbi:hypothetical protein Pla175_30440 [Pirellulimonas nuda]|uniref:Carboxypeptidase regulatory-like domain-containing protein n=1 Tax=Pirellulimonas nuda TaxID=2528009 RepID=A0A518DDU4_9BACT|nr:DUF4198 domain-containing protein [Pirellulimonas nuda]QDU89651.1 hypothetical protein Pla175_30440 [Pirellulimonas nuda]
MKRNRMALALAAVLLVCGGCSEKPIVPSNRTRVSGVVLLDGQPLKGGTVGFTLATPPHSRGSTGIRSDGTFTITAAPKGECLVTVETESLLLGSESSYVKIPREYSDPKKSGLKATITPEGGEFTFELKSKR